MMHFSLKSPTLALASLAVMLLVTAGIYYPALDGLFLLDDAQSLKDLAEIDRQGIWFYLFGNNAGPGGRPLSLLSFALQHQSWPADPFAFKLVNLLLHLGNGVLVYTLVTMLLPRIRPDGAGTVWFPLAVTALWLLHPMQLSTVLYVVQRMTLLATTFTLAGILVYLAGRQNFSKHPLPQVVILSLFGVYLCIGLAVAGKESGVLLPLYLLVLEFTLLAPSPDRRWRPYMVPALLLPLLLVTLYLLRGGLEGLLASYHGREFTLSTRLLSEAGALLSYLRLIILPTVGSFSLFHDDFPVAAGLFDPPSTLLYMILTGTLLVSALALSRRLPVYAFAVLWFFAGHMLESTVIPLELYFEHRNYLPMLGPVVFMLWALERLAAGMGSAVFRRGIIPSYLLAVFVVVLLEAGLWSKPYLQAQEWARQHPQSKRALNHLANISLIFGRESEADESIRRLQALDPDDIYPVIKQITMHSCYRRETIPASDWIRYNGLAARARYRGLGVLSEIEHQLYQFTHGHCDALDVSALRRLIERLIANPEFDPVRGELLDNAATFAVMQGRLQEALDYLDRSLKIAPDMDRQVLKLRILAATPDPVAAGQLLQQIRVQLQDNPRQSLYFRDVIAEVERQLQSATGGVPGQDVSNGGGQFE